MPRVNLTQEEIDVLWVELKEMEGINDTIDSIQEKLRRLATCSY